jgi:cobalt-precorrin-5B (C1)-methyltransferase
MISAALADLVPEGAGWKVTISVPRGAELARRTFNGRLGIAGGISILGTTGYVEPRSLEALRRSLPPLLDIVRAAGYRTVCLVPGNIGHRAARRLQPPPAEAQIVEIGDFLGFMLDEVHARRFAMVSLVGHAGKLAKVLNGHWQTHSTYAPAANAVVVELFADFGLSGAFVQELKTLPTVEAVQRAVIRSGHAHLPVMLAGRIRQLVRERLKGEVAVSVHLCDLDGNIVGEAR